MDLQDRYDELDNIESTLRILANEITDKHYKEIFLETMYEAQQEKEQIEPKLQEMYDEEERELEQEYERSVI